LPGLVPVANTWFAGLAPGELLGPDVGEEPEDGDEEKEENVGSGGWVEAEGEGQFVMRCGIGRV
jgi:hypothetical protein